MQIFDGLHTKVQLISKRVIYEYDAFGNVVISEEKIRNIFKFTGEQYDQLTGQYYLKARYYNPVIGRFTQMDTYLGDGLNLYAYVQNNPVRYVDPRGHISANAANGVDLETLATTPEPFRNGQISVTTVGEIRSIGMDVIPDPTKNNPYHVSIVPQNVPISPEDADTRSNLFKRQENKWKPK